MTVLSLVPGEAAWRSRKVQYYAGDWASIQTVIPEFDFRPFAAGQDEPPNPFLQAVIRRPLSAAERPIPVGIVSHTYSLVPHREIATLCREALIDIGIESNRYEVGEIGLGKYVEATVIAGLLLFNATRGFIQEGRATAALKALKKRLAPTALVRRDGEWTKLPAAELVPGDVVSLALGALVPADAHIVSGSVMVDQSMNQC